MTNVDFSGETYCARNIQKYGKKHLPGLKQHSLYSPDVSCLFVHCDYVLLPLVTK